jgi:toxic protein SymE
MRQEENFQQNGERRLKVIEKHFSRAHYKYVVFPEIRLSGKWLGKLGFKQGQTVIIAQGKNKLTITIDKGHKKIGAAPTPGAAPVV